MGAGPGRSTHVEFGPECSEPERAQQDRKLGRRPVRMTLFPMSAVEMGFSRGDSLLAQRRSAAAASAQQTECEVLLGFFRCFQPQESAKGKASQEAADQKGPQANVDDRMGLSQEHQGEKVSSQLQQLALAADCIQSQVFMHLLCSQCRAPTMPLVQLI